jgi:Protein of unknown function (DUF3575)
MKKLTSLFTIIFLLFLTAQSQDNMGYKTFDAGGEFMGSGKGYTAALHLAYNLAVHNSFQVRIGYNKSNWKSSGKHDKEEGSGPGISLGYRYYFLVRPHGFFLGIRADAWRMKVNWSQGDATGISKLWAIQPAAEMGYMLLINDIFFITPSISAGLQNNLKTEGQAVGDGFIPQFGLSAGWKF